MEWGNKMKAYLTDIYLKSLKPKKSRYEVWDENFTGGSFGIRVSKTGKKSWVLLYRNSAGRLRRRTLGNYPYISLSQARRLARADLGTVARGDDPTHSKKGPIFGEVADHFLKIYPAEAGLAEKTSKEYERILIKDILPVFGDIEIATITRADVNELLDSIAHRETKPAPVLANRVLSLMSLIFNYAIDRDYWGITQNPCYRSRQRTKEKTRSRVLTDDEIRTLWAEWDKRESGPVYKVLIMTGQRSGEVKAMRWDEICGDVWTIPAEKTKSRKRDHKVPLTEKVKAILEGLDKSSEWIFPSRKGGHIRWLGNNTMRIRRAVGFHFTPHDLRRTVATRMAELGISDRTIARILNHEWVYKDVTTKHYALDDRLPEKRQALERWTAMLDQILTGKPAKVVKIG